MLGDTLTITIAGSGGTAKVLKKIREDNYSSEYFLNDDTVRYNARIRHLSETSSGKGKFPIPVDRHQVTFRAEWGAGTDAEPLSFREVSMTIRNHITDVPAYASDLGEALAFWASEANLLKVIGWES